MATGTNGNDFIHVIGDGHIVKPGYHNGPFVSDGNDTIIPLSGNDIVYAGAGNDLIEMGANLNAADQIFGEDGYDRVSVNGDYGTLAQPVTLNDATFSSIEEMDFFGDHSYHIHLTDGDIDPNVFFVFNATATSSNDTVDVNAGAETNARIHYIGGPGVNIAEGGSGNDYFDLSVSGRAQINGGGGNDTIYAGAHFRPDDSIDGGDGRDTLSLNGDYSLGIVLNVNTANGIEDIFLNAGHSYKLIATGQTTPIGGSLTIDGSFLAAGQTLKFDGSAEDFGSFVLRGGAGDDSLVGGEGNDAFSLVKGGADTALGGYGDDIFYAGARLGDLHIEGSSGSDTIDLDGDYSAGLTLTSAVMTNIERLLLTASHSYNLSLNGTGLGGAGGLIIDGSQLGTADHLLLNAIADPDGVTMIGGAGNDTLIGSGSAPSNGFDLSSGGNDLCLGGSGSDTFYMHGALTGADRLDGAGGINIVVLGGDYSAGVTLDDGTLTNINEIQIGNSNHAYKLTMADGNIASGHFFFVNGTLLNANEALTLNDQAETNGRNDIEGGAGNDMLSAGKLADTLGGNAGDDRLNGGIGADSMIGGLGNDTFIVDNAGDGTFETANGGSDTVFSAITYALSSGQSIELLATTSQAGTTAINLTGNEQSQAINGNAGDNRLSDGGGAGPDTMTGFAGNDVYVVNNAGDRVVEAISAAGSDTVFASVGYQLQNGQSVELLATTSQAGTTQLNLTGNDLAQTIRGNEGLNGLYGGDGNDSLYGFGGNDRLVGGNGRDVMDGGAGNDVFAYGAVSDSTGANRDLIQNVDLSATDKFQFTVKPTAGIHAIVTTGSLSQANFDHDLQIAIAAGQLGAHQAVLFDPDAGDLNVSGHVFLVVDVNGTAGYQAGADYVIELQNLSGTLTTDDFL